MKASALCLERQLGPTGRAAPTAGTAPGYAAATGRHLRAGRRGATFKENEQTEVHGSGADKCCGYNTVEMHFVSGCLFTIASRAADPCLSEPGLASAPLAALSSQLCFMPSPLSILHLSVGGQGKERTFFSHTFRREVNSFASTALGTFDARITFMS